MSPSPQDAVDPPHNGSSTAEELIDTPPVLLRRPGILVVDDEARIRTILGMALRDHGFTVFQAEDGPEALALYKQHRDRIEAVLVDAALPDVGGLAFVSALKTLQPRVRCCLLGENPGPFTREELQQRGVLRLFPRPLQLSEVVPIVWSLVLRTDPPTAAPDENGVDNEELAAADRRAAARHSCGREYLCLPAGSVRGEPWRARLTNISAVGTRLLLDRQLEIGTLLVLRIPHAVGNDATNLFARVVRVAPECEGHWSLGCAFTRRLHDAQLRDLIA
jgi:CheY-like chemotaxis protein